MSITRKDLDEAVATAQRSGKRVTLRDVDGSGRRDSPERGLSAIIGPTGNGRWTYAYRPHGRRDDGRRHGQKWVRIGGIHTLGVEEARQAVRRLKERVADGGDPIAEDRTREIEAERARIAEASRNMRLEEAVDRYISQKANSVAHIDGERMQLRCALREMGLDDPRIDDIEKRHVMDLIERNRLRPATARQRYGALNRLYKWLLARDLVSRNPCAAIDGLPSPPQPRTWKPDADELRALWRAADAIGGPRGRFLKALTVVPLRLNEMARLAPNEIVDGQIVLHGKRTKNGDDFSIPIPSTYRYLFEPDNDMRVFQLATSGDFNARKSVVAALRRESGVQRFHFHALRKLFLSELAEHDIGDPDLADSLLNHRQSETRSGVRAAYLQARRRKKKVAVMEAWGRLVNYAVRHGHWPREVDAPNDNVVGFAYEG